MGWGKTFLLPGDDVKTPGLERRMGWERREATLEQEGGNGLGVLRKGARAGGSGPGRAGGAPPPPPAFPTYCGKELPARELVRGVGADVAPTRDAGTGSSTSPLPLAHLHPCRTGAGAGGAGSPAPAGSGSGGGGGGGECCSLAPSRGDVGARVPGDRRRGPPGSGRAMGRAEARSERQAGAWWHALHVFNIHTRAQIALSV